MDTASAEFLARLQRGPAVLLLGQRHLAAESGHDPLLALLGDKHGGHELHTYGDIPKLGLEGSADETLAWMDERCRRLLPAESLKTLAEYPWSAVVTSAIDTVWPTAFRQPWRDLQPVFDERHQPADPRNRHRLHCFFLYGNVNRVVTEERVPLSPFALAKRDQVALGMARRLPDLVTPLGVLAIEGYGGADWLRPEYLAPILADLNAEQVHLFAPDDDLLSEPFFTELQRLGILVTHNRSLARTLSEGIADGLVRVGPLDSEEELRQIRMGSAALPIPAEIWKRIPSSATILDDSAMTTPKEVSPDILYRDFRAFLGAGEGVPSWEGLARGFAFPRDFEAELAQTVTAALASPGAQEKPIMLHGPTGSGKTIALASLARNVRLEFRYPVLFVERRVIPSYADLDLFCEWAEQQGATATLIAWDGMVDSPEYRRALQYLGSRGRNAVIVGTSYRVRGDAAEGHGYITAPPHLTPTERERFLAFLRRFDSGLEELVTAYDRIGEDAFLVALYRLLPPARGVVRSGVSREMRHAERSMAEQAGQITVEYRPPNAMARALLDAGLLAPDELSTEFVQRVGTEAVDGFEHLTGLVMVPGRFGLRVPLELLLRVLGQDGFNHFLQLLSGVDIFRWYEDAAGNIEIGARNGLEAMLIAQARTGGPETEVALVREMLLELRQDPDARSGGRELDFGVNLLQAIGPQGQHAGVFASHFGMLADTLYEARTGLGLINARLMLQEANLRREAAMVSAKLRDPDDRYIDESLDAAEDAVRDALGLLPSEPHNRTLRSLLLVELASTIGTRSTRLFQGDSGPATQALELLHTQKEVVADARLEDPSNFHSVDVLAWTTRNAIAARLLTGADKVEAVADVMSAFQATDINELSGSQAAQYHTRRYEMATLIGDADLQSVSAQALKAQGSGAVIFLKALHTSGLSTLAPDAPPNVDLARAAVEELESEAELLWQDDRCLDLYLDLWWLARTGRRLFDGERLTPGLTTKQWERCLSVVTTLSERESTRRPAVLAFLGALALFHLERTSESFAAFKEVERQSMAAQSRRRVVRSYLASTKDGAPRAFHGTISWLDSGLRKGDIQVEELRARVTFFSHDFRVDDPRLGLDVGVFHIAFNFLGPIADPALPTARR